MKRKKRTRVKMKPHQLRDYIEQMKTQHLMLKHEIEACEFELEQSQCPDCTWRYSLELKEMCHAAQNARMLPKVVRNLEEFLAEDEAANGWKGEDRWIVF